MCARLNAIDRRRIAKKDLQSGALSHLAWTATYLCNLCKYLAEQPRTPQSSLPAASRQSCNVAVWGRQARQAACALLLVDKSEEVQCRRSCQAAAWSLTAPHLARIQSAGGQNLPRRARNLHSDLYLFQILIKPLAYYSTLKEILCKSDFVELRKKHTRRKLEV